MPSKGRAASRLPTTPEEIRTERNGAAGPAHVLAIQRARILAAMIEVSAERGTRSVSVAHVVDRAGVSRRTFYELFGDREACFLAAFDEGIERAWRHIADSYDPSDPWLARVRTALIALLGFLESEHALGRLLVVCSLAAGPEVLARRQSAISRMVALVDEGRLEGKASIELSPLTAEGIVGGVLSLLHKHLLADDAPRILELAGPLMSMVVSPYLGAAVAKRELKLVPPSPRPANSRVPADPLRDMNMRLTYRTVRVLATVAAHPGSSNREIGTAAEINDQGQISKLLSRLARLGLIENAVSDSSRGSPNAWMLTGVGERVERTLACRAGGDQA